MKSLVTGANGHLGNNLVRHLLANDESVIAGVRNTSNNPSLEGLKCEKRYTDLLNKKSLVASLQGVDVLYQVGAVFQRWSKNPDKDIIQPNIAATINILEAAAEAKVKKVVYVSSTSALDPSTEFDGSNWNPIEKNNPYTYSKVESEKLAHKLAKEVGLDISFILPTAIIGGSIFGPTPTLELFASVYNKQLPFAPNFKLMMVDVRDVASACHVASRRGINGKRYVISSEKAISVTDLFNHIQNQFPDDGYKTPNPPPKALFFFLANVSELISSFSGKPPLITKADAKEFWGANPSVNLQNAKRDFGFKPMSIENSISDTFDYFKNLSDKSK